MFILSRMYLTIAKFSNLALANLWLGTTWESLFQSGECLDSTNGLINKIFGQRPCNQRSDSMLTLSTRFLDIITKKLGLLDEDCEIEGFLCTVRYISFPEL